MKCRNHVTGDYRTTRQWAKVGMLPNSDITGTEMWCNGYCNNSAIYYLPSEVHNATEEELFEFWKPIKQKRYLMAKKRREANTRLQEKEIQDRVDSAYERGMLDATKIYNQRIKMLLSRLQEMHLKEEIETNEYHHGSIIIDCETTGMEPGYDEILQLSIISIDGTVLHDSYYSPIFITSWDATQTIHGISPEFVDGKPFVQFDLQKIQSILDNASAIIGYNATFDLSFLNAIGVKTNTQTVYDVMTVFSEIYGEWNEFYQNYKWQSLETCAAYYNYDWSLHGKAHNALADCYATLHCYNKIEEQKIMKRIN